ncbi:MAG TPA: hypothetical protein VFO63_15745, partial [Blastocatellia bacterium]|nr:hypothetical protein [Blastocatellia bacterium]
SSEPCSTDCVSAVYSTFVLYLDLKNFFEHPGAGIEFDFDRGRVLIGVRSNPDASDEWLQA